MKTYLALSLRVRSLQRPGVAKRLGAIAYWTVVLCLFAPLPYLRGQAETNSLPPIEWQLTRQIDFAAADKIDQWDLIGGAWQFVSDQDPAVLRIVRKASDWRPPHRSPGHLALLREPVSGSFRLDIRAKSTHEPYGHRDVCFYFGYQGPDKFYYVHLAQQTDDHAHQIFIVNQADRIKISKHNSPGVDWGQEFHQIRIERELSSGTIQVFFDDLKQPLFSAVDKTFGAGRIGFGSFDDTAEFAALELWEPKK